MVAEGLTMFLWTKAALLAKASPVAAKVAVPALALNPVVGVTVGVISGLVVAALVAMNVHAVHTRGLQDNETPGADN